MKVYATFVTPLSMYAVARALEVGAVVKEGYIPPAWLEHAEAPLAEYIPNAQAVQLAAFVVLEKDIARHATHEMELR